MSKNKFSGNISGKGYYIALILCAVAIGVSGYLYYRNTNEPSAQQQSVEQNSVEVVQQDVPAAATRPQAEVVVPTQPAVPTTEAPVVTTEPETVPETTEDTRPGVALTLGNNSLISGTKYVYTATEDGRLEIDFTSIKDGEGKAVYQYAYGKGTRVKILINGKYAANLLDNRVTVSKGQTITVELQSLDSGTYTAEMTLASIAPANKLALGDNAIAKKTDYSFIATQSGTLYTTIKELWYDGTYCSEASLSATVVFRINGVAVSQFRNSYEVKAGDEITVNMGLSFGSDPASAVLNLSYEGFYEHPAGSRGNPYTLSYAECPTNTVQIPGGTSVWYKLYGFGGDAQITVTGANAYVIVGGVRRDAVNGSVTVPAYSSLQIGNAGSTPATFQISAYIAEGTSGNPKDLAEGKQTVSLPERDNY